MHPADIQAALKKAGFRQSDVARSITNRVGKPVSQAAIYLVVQGSTVSARIAARISEMTGLPVAQLWPGKYPQLEQQQGGSRGRSNAHRRAA